VDGNEIVYYHQDGLGSTLGLSDSSGDLVESYQYDVFGSVTIFDGTGTVLPATAKANRFLYTGREWIQEVGLYDYRNRVYSPELGRFLQSDPIRFDAEDVNLYRYVGNSPTILTDPNGEAALPALLAVLVVTIWAKACKDKSVDEAREAFPGDDKKQHCYASCAFTKCMGYMSPQTTFIGGIIHEIANPTYGFQDALADIRANIEGIIAAYTFSDCKEGCKCVGEE
jgi:RHS repeat-associated protein